MITFCRRMRYIKLYVVMMMKSKRTLCFLVFFNLIFISQSVFGQRTFQVSNDYLILETDTFINKNADYYEITRGLKVNYKKKATRINWPCMGESTASSGEMIDCSFNGVEIIVDSLILTFIEIEGMTFESNGIDLQYYDLWSIKLKPNYRDTLIIDDKVMVNQNIDKIINDTSLQEIIKFDELTFYLDSISFYEYCRKNESDYFIEVHIVRY